MTILLEIIRVVNVLQCRNIVGRGGIPSSCSPCPVQCRIAHATEQRLSASALRLQAQPRLCVCALTGWWMAGSQPFTREATIRREPTSCAYQAVPTRRQASLFAFEAPHGARVRSAANCVRVAPFGSRADATLEGPAKARGSCRLCFAHPSPFSRGPGPLQHLGYVFVP